MQLECKQCHQLLNLPDDKLPIGRPFSFNCPYCKEKNTAMIDPPGEQPFLAETQLPTEGPTASSMPMPPASAPSDTYAADGSYQAPQSAEQFQAAAPPTTAPPTPLRAPAGGDEAYSAVHMPAPSAFSGGQDESDNSQQLTIQQLMSGDVDERLKALVVYDDLDIAEKLEQKLDTMGFQVSVAMNQRDAAKQLKFSNFTLVLIQEDYYGASLAGNHLLKSLQGLEGHSRRGMLVVLISPTMTTLDDLLAFSLSLDAIINSAELDNIERILISTIGRSRKFYAIYREVLAAEGLD